MSLKQTCQSLLFACFLGAKSEQISNVSKEDADFIGPYADIRVSLLHIWWGSTAKLKDSVLYVLQKTRVENGSITKDQGVEAFRR